MRPATPSLPRQVAALAAFLLACFLVSGLGGFLTSLSVDTWYQELEKPPYNPPDWIFAPVWSLLYVMIAVAGWLVWRRTEIRAAQPAFALYGAQLALNLLWSALFFGLRSPLLGLVGIVALWLAIAATLIAFTRYERLAAALLAPYLAWVTFAFFLNLAIWRLN
ncbi:MAG: tryptophan-rich sensory protein [Alphaproteobacteria bacterium]|nr:tryptophan-rich sensory protein [Alphaproteobacteria bacterium]